MSTEKKNRIILGLMTFGPDRNDGARITSLTEFKNILTAFRDRGYIELDTARVYCGSQQESFTASAGWKQTGFTIATKLYPNQPGIHKAASIKENIAKSLSELGMEKVDLWYFHAPDRSVPFEETLERLGLSNYTAFEVAEICTLCKERGWVKPSVYQGMYNVITRAIEKELFVACRKYGLDIVVYNPLAGGFFTGNYKSPALPESGRFSNTNPSGSIYRARYFNDHYFNALKLIEPVAEKHNLTMVEIAFRWLLHHSVLNIKNGNDGIILDVSSQKQLEENLDQLEKGPLPSEVVEVLNKAWEVVNPNTPNYWHLELKYTYDTTV
ncbi:aflatoxin B1 aldehyde reductase member 2 [Morchella conica CCBAS932]|uniref:Aflatoxin B1 aldehyde reductase member 2 n=1 Tax=Morchella conica CCBAS932 TaxID=1392247 RepID=A0A3N4KNZ6_9PEZI|nr:aflatoxin B1 aldehyde reductase member 2 [Morchella conica CCBAS932]